ncbi:hypothetical protein B9Z19DRAFT_769929 [Tuber borchii]|uniref:Uncharacterized protein n=1 Tax=Tuber borchii TaxID=42251 RepID=A0A2T6ZX42_TUBBO|nr:hypothetical protein B9Z19DRAFT_769929 [Tuber borchii]
MSNFPPRIVWFHVQKWKVLANRVQRGLQHSPVTDGDFDILKEPGPEHLIANLVDILPFRLLSRLMLETTLKGMLRLSCREKLTAQRASEQELESGMISQEMDLMSQFGGFGGSWSLAGTPYHFDPVDFCDPFRPDIPHDLLYEIYVQDLILRSNLRGRIENMILGAHGTPEVYGWLSQLLWDHLYQIPASFPG